MSIHADTETAQAAADRSSILRFLRGLPLAPLLYIRDLPFARWGHGSRESRGKVCLVGAAEAAGWVPQTPEAFDLYSAAWAAFDRRALEEGLPVVVPFVRELARVEAERQQRWFLASAAARDWARELVG